MPPAADRAQRELWAGAGDAWTMVTELLTATAVWGAIGFGLDRAFNTWPILFVVGVVAGHATGIYIVWRRTRLAQERARGAREGET
jgi:F0F1-type ATP synthase assembly protein I